MWLYIIALQNRTRHCTQSTSIDLPGNTLTEESLWCKSVIVVSQCFSAVQNCVKYFCLPPLKFSSPPSCPPSFTGLVPPLLVLPFGISSASEIWQRVMITEFGSLEGVEVVVDDILVCGEKHGPT